MLGISPGAGAVGESPTTADRVDWLAAETRPWVDEISVQGSEQLPVGGVGEVSASIVQDGLEAPVAWPMTAQWGRSEEHTSELQSRGHLVCRLLLEKKD